MKMRGEIAASFGIGVDSIWLKTLLTNTNKFLFVVSRVPRSAELSDDIQPQPTRKYDKGERRRKHVGSGDRPEFRAHYDSPRRIIGKCPATISASERERLLNRAVPLRNGDRDLSPPKKVYAVYEGAIYEAQTSDHGQTYHAYPFRGKLSDALIDLLRDMAREDGYLPEFEAWRKTNVVRNGR